MSNSKQSRKINRFFAEFIAKLRKWLNKIGSPIRISRRFVRKLFGATKGQRKGSTAGFVLPTVTLVTLIVTLLVVTTVSRSSERAQTASNARTEQVFKSAATPVIDRARAKIDALLNDGKLPRTTPPEATLDSVITSDSGKYTLPDETRLQLVYDFRKPAPASTASAAEISSAAIIPDQKINASSSNKIEEKEYVSTAWKFPIDTNNNGKFDSYGIYSILFRARPPSVTARPTVPIESRTLPMDETTLTGTCTQASSSSNVASDGGWTLSSDNRLKKSFFVYAVTVPITDAASFPSELTTAQKAASYEVYSGATSISAVELQQDRARLPQNNNAVFFEGDLDLVNVATFRINGRIYTAGSLMVGTLKNFDFPISFYQVSSSGGSPSNGITEDSKLFGSCYYEKKNSEIVVAGQLVEGDAVSSDTATLSNTAPVKVDLFFKAGAGVPPNNVTGGQVTIDETNQSVTDSSSRIALNEFAYNNRISALVTDAITINGGVSIPSTISSSFKSSDLIYATTSTKDPTSVQEDLVKRIQDEALSSQAEVNTARRAAFTSYFSERTRKVSFGQVSNTDIETFIPTTSTTSPLLTRIPVVPVAGQPSELVPPIDWMLPLFTNTEFGQGVGSFSFSSGAGFDGKGAISDSTTKGFTLKTTGSKLSLSASDPSIVAKSNEALLGDRVLVGNGLPAQWLKKSDITGQLEFVGNTVNNAINNATTSGTTSAATWDNATTERYRNTRSLTLSSLGVTDRGGFWEISAALDPSIADPTAPTSVTAEVSPRTGGLRVVTNAGIYSRRPEDTFLPRFRTGVADDPATSTVDESSMPIWNGQPINNPITSVDETKFASPRTAADTNTDRERSPRNYVVWPDSMPMTSVNAITDQRKGDLQMRATAIYHYKYDAYNAIGTPNDYQAPIACVSSYYDPSTPTTAKNASTAPWNGAAGGRSNNGLVYKVGFTANNIDFSGITLTNGVFSATTNGVFSEAARQPSDSTNTATSYRDKLAYQANLIFPNGRFANEPLRDVITKLLPTTAPKLTLSQQSTLDSNLCALQILNGTAVLANASSTSATIAISSVAGTTALTSAEIPHGAFRESAFLDGREVKSLNRNESLIEAANGNNPRDASGTFTTTGNGLANVAKNRGDLYDLEMEQRQPVEIRATDIDMDRLRGSKIVGGLNKTGVDTDYLLSYSGIVYATREDALADLSYYDIDANGDPKLTDDTKRKNLSSTDFLLDPTRKPSSIRLVNGYRLWRSSLTTANLINTDGSGTTAAVSNTTYASFPWTETNKGEKGLTLVSNLPVYVKAQFDPSNPTSTTIVPSFNKHTREEFTQTLLDDWSNFYKRHAANGDLDKLDPNFACRPRQNTGCALGDEWRPATVLADAVTVLSANYRDGYRTDGDYDLRNNANTSTSINWQSQLNQTLPTSDTTGINRDPRKDSSYVLDMRRVGLFNNNYVTSSTWLNPVNSDAKTVTSSDVWPGDPDNTTAPNNGNLASYNANGVTPIQRRVSFGEYGMEICRKVPASECTFSDWVKDSAGTTTLPDFSSTVPSAVTTPTGAPRYISNDDSRFARRLSFLRFDDIYKDGNEQLIFAGSCTGSPPVFWPMPIGVTNGNVAAGYTYPQVMGGLSTPFDGRATNNYSYGNVPCPETRMTVELGNVGLSNSAADTKSSNSIPNKFEQNNRDATEGRRRNQNTGGALETQLGSTNLPQVVWTTDAQGNSIGTPTSNTGIVTNNFDVDSTVLADNPPAGNGFRSDNNAVYRRVNFAVRLNNRSLLADAQTIRVKVTLFPITSTGSYAGNVGDAFPLITDDSTGTTTNTKTDFLRGLYNGTGVTVDLKRKNGTTVNVPIGGLYPVNPSSPATAIATGDPEDSPCPNTNGTDNEQFCTVISWTGRTAVNVPTTANDRDPDTKVVSVLIVRDSAPEKDNEQFRLSLDNLIGSGVFYAEGAAGNYATNTTNQSIRLGQILINSPNQLACIPIGTALPPNSNLTNNDDIEQPPVQCSPSGGGGGTGGGGGRVSISLPVFASLPKSSAMPFLMIAPPAAAYPFPHTSSTGANTNIEFRPFKPPSDVGLGLQEGGRYVWGDDINENKILDAGERTDIFPNIPPRPGPIGEIPMLPGNFARVIDNSNAEQMTRNRPASVSRTLWYRTSGSDGNYTGEGENILYNRDRNLFLNQLSFPFIGSGSSGQLRANLSTTGSLILPNTPCIRLTDGTVDDRCISKSYLFGKNTPTDTSTTLLNLNLPYNPHFPSDNTSARNITSGTQPASSFVVCGATGNTRKYQAIERPALSKTDISGDKCAQAADSSGEAIRKFVGRLVTTTTTTGNGSTAVTTTTVTGGSGLLSLSLLPSDASFKGLRPDVTKKNDGTTTRDLGNAVSPNTSNIDMALRATNTYANNKVNVFSFNNATDKIGTLDSGTRNLTGTITFRANCADPITGLDSPTCTSTSVRRGPSPVFIMRGDPDESINFKGLQIRLDGVDPNNIFWVSARVQKRLEAKTSSGNFVLTPGDGKDPLITVGRKIIFSDKSDTVPA
ncbi:MAG: hormogonium polysaccharide biosynthesis protein HpsA [Pseudanabaena sp. CAN_BIN31]|nr:hormogonium polysaccharide biosynthesis protein HpsA [Pseudanabaena sp. CAN_BIN31]